MRPPDTTCPLVDDVPGCETGPAGRLAWVAREVVALIRDFLAGHDRRTAIARTETGP